MAESPADPDKIELYQSIDQLPPVLWETVAALSPDQAARRSVAGFDRERGYRVHFLGGDYLVHPEKRTITPEEAPDPCFQTGLVLLNYLIHAADDGLAGRMVTERELEGGSLFFNGPHVLRRGPVLKKYGRNASGLLQAAEPLGGAAAPGGDAAFRVLALPKILVSYILYEADEEFDASLTVTFDASADRHLPLDSIWAMINVLSERLAKGPGRA